MVLALILGVWSMLLIPIALQPIRDTTAKLIQPRRPWRWVCHAMAARMQATGSAVKSRKKLAGWIASGMRLSAW